MKIISTLLVTSFTLITLQAQNLINGGFEDTSLIYNQPAGKYDTLINSWTNVSGFGMGVTDDAHTGTLAAYVWNWYYYAQGILSNGNATWPHDGGQPISFRPTKLTGHYKYIYGDNQGNPDSAMVEVWLLKYNSALMDQDTIGMGIAKLGPQATYESFSVNIDYRSPAMPDTVLVKFLSSENGFCGTHANCLFFYVDDVALSDQTTGIQEAVGFNPIGLYPNPTSGQLNLHFNDKTLEGELVSIIDIHGKQIWSQPLGQKNTIRLNTKDLVPGHYVVKIGNWSKRFLKQ